ncbi:DMT family transporter [Savagea sp. SN6]|uniref:DMT family transporter n=1 Tax=Savagea serpentis TaxID=2785297 RepID=A0A8J7KSM1_9BACL|nr:DMT family transporter [Savagea serpentis]MBF4500724.1 DMT family transporter [Savagea serpentis]
MRNNIFVGALLAIIASASWGAMFPVANDAFLHIDPFYFTIIRYLPVALILSVALWMVEGKEAFKTEGNGFQIWFFGTMGFTVYNLFIFWGQNMLGDSGVVLASIMESLAPIISVLIVWGLYKQRPHAFTMFTVVGAFVGVLLVVTNGDFLSLFGPGRLVPFIILLIAAGGWAFYTIGGSVFPRWTVLRYSALSVLYGTLTATVVVMISSLIGWIDVPTMAEVYTVRYHMLFMIFIPGLLALIFWNQAVVILKPINAILFINVAPVTTIIIRVLQGYTVSFYEIAGVLIVSVMIIANNLYQRSLLQHERRKRLSLKNKAKTASSLQ